MKFLDPHGMLSKLGAEFGTFKDPRDGKEYSTVKIDGIEWFREDLDYDDHEDYTGGMGDLFGGLHVPSYKENESSRMYGFDESQAACPDGWRIPDRSDWINLFRKITDNKAPYEWHEKERHLIHQTLVGKNSVLRLKLNGNYTEKSESSWEKNRFNHFRKKGYYWSSTPGSLTNGGACFIFRKTEGDYAEEVFYGFCAARPIKKNI
jgi:uncharacterized protein (TIGR02145 family)